ncbi:cell division protein ZapE [Brachybacterium sp. JHP9]|uniref:Cell division protein ZapE n=1 Tax=Brachybacterium equifaecis TaxID=2910770 RepID=A0ABT0R0S9_9MICO|nr:cell division protein ZapE [Brachybacterium equifaecis]
MTDTLTSRRPNPPLDRLVADLVPPPRFAQARLENYIPDPRFPSQAAAKEQIGAFARGIGKPAGGGGLRGMFRKKPAAARGLYLDGGFGVGKTHLLTSLFHATEGHRVYGTFVEYTNLVGALGFNRAIELFGDAILLCIDEFELDDPGDTLLMTRLIRELSDRGVSIVATSNTLPEALGEGRFAAQDFLREIQTMSERFEVLRIDGHDYRRRDAVEEAPALDPELVASHAAATPGATLDGFPELLRHLATVHPSRYGAMLDGVSSVHLQDLAQIANHNDGLRFVVLVDRLYDREIPVLASGQHAAQMYSAELLASGYRKKYYRSLSRLSSLARDGAALVTRNA